VSQLLDVWHSKTGKTPPPQAKKVSSKIVSDSNLKAARALACSPLDKVWNGLHHAGIRFSPAEDSLKLGLEVSREGRSRHLVSKSYVSPCFTMFHTSFRIAKHFIFSNRLPFQRPMVPRNLSMASPLKSGWDAMA
jgi:hypothetical protein